MSARDRRPPPRRAPGRALVVAGATALALLAAGTSTTRSDWTTGAVTGSGSARTGTVATGHAYQATTCTQGQRVAEDRACGGSIAPTLAATASGVSATDTVTNNGTLGSTQLRAEVRAASCAPVQLANRRSTARPLLPRHGTTFHSSGGPMTGSGYLGLDGGAAGGYATAAVASTQPGGGLLSAGTLSGVGVWFRVAPGTSGPLFTFAASPSDGAGSADRTLYLDTSGRLRLVWNAGGSAIGPSAAYDDGAWHYAHVTFGGVNVFLVGLIPQVTLWVDGAQQATTPLLSLSPLSSYSGYWHLGWAPTSVTGLATTRLTGSLSNFVVDDTGAIPSGASIGAPATQTAFDAAIGTVTDHWPLDDTGTTTFGGTLPSTMTNPCAKVDLAWGFTNPSASATTTTPLSTFADDTWRSVAAPPLGGSQTSTITVRRGTGWHVDLAGLRLYAPLSYRVQSVPVGSPWRQTFTWSGAEAAFVA
jgi:hypothetical protein